MKMNRNRGTAEPFGYARRTPVWLGLFSLILAAGLAAALMLLVSSQASAAATGTTYTITDKFDDNLPNNSTCTLREAVMAANSDTAYDNCPAGSGADTIMLQSGVYTLTIGGTDDVAFLGDLDIITGSLTIKGAGADATTIKSANNHRIFDIDPANTGPQLPSSVNVVIEDVTIRDGIAVEGAGIRNKGVLTVTNSVIVNNHASITKLPLCPSGCSGGGLMNQGAAATVINSSIISNSAGLDGGGMISWGKIRIFNSTISGNDAGYGGGGVYIDESVTSLPESSDAIMNNVTITNNRADTNMDGKGMGGGIFFRHKAVMTVTNTILASNFSLSTGSNSPSDCVLETHPATLPIHSGGYNLIGAGDLCGWVSATGDLTGTASTPLDPKLDALSTNGASTFTHALMPGSLAIDHGSPASPGSGGSACEVADQRGITRPRGWSCDMGAFESDGSAGVFLPLVHKSP